VSSQPGPIMQVPQQACKRVAGRVAVFRQGSRVRPRRPRPGLSCPNSRIRRPILSVHGRWIRPRTRGALRRAPLPKGGPQDAGGVPGPLPLIQGGIAGCEGDGWATTEGAGPLAWNPTPALPFARGGSHPSPPGGEGTLLPRPSGRQGPKTNQPGATPGSRAQGPKAGDLTRNGAVVAPDRMKHLGIAGPDDRPHGIENL
jgi:hypothetical protein